MSGRRIDFQGRWRPTFPLQPATTLRATHTVADAHTDTYKCATRRETHPHNSCSSSLPLAHFELTVDEVEFSSLLLPLSLSLSVTVSVLFAVLRVLSKNKER